MELNNLIGELDLFQKEHEQLSRNTTTNNSETPTIASSTGSGSVSGSGSGSTTLNETDSDLNDKLSLQGYNYSTTSSDSRFNGSDDLDMGFENPSFTHMNGGAMKINSEIVVLRCKDNNSIETSLNGSLSSLTSPNGIGSKNESLQRFSSFRTTTTLMGMNNSDQNQYNHQQVVVGINNGVHIDDGGGVMENGDSCSDALEHPPVDDDDVEESYILSKVNLRNVENSGVRKICNDKLKTITSGRLKPVVSPRPASLSGLFFYFNFFLFFSICVKFSSDFQFLYL